MQLALLKYLILQVRVLLDEAVDVLLLAVHSGCQGTELSVGGLLEV